MRTEFVSKPFWLLVLTGTLVSTVVVGCTPGITTAPVASLTPMLSIVAHTPTPTALSRSAATPAVRPPLENDTAFMIRLQSRQFIPEADVKSGLNWLQTVPDSRAHVLLQLYGPPDSTTSARLEKSGIRLLNYIPSNAWFASVPRTLQIEDPAIPLMRWLGPILPEDKVAEGLLEGSIGTWALREGNRIALEVSFFEDMNLQDGEQVIREYGGTIIRSTPMSNKLTVEVPKEVISLLATEDSVRWIDVIPPPPTTDSEGG